MDNQMLAQLLQQYGQQAQYGQYGQPQQSQYGQPLYGAKKGLFDEGLQGIIGGIGREGGGLLGQAFGSMFGNSAGNVDFGGGNMFVPSQGFMRQQQAPSQDFVGAMPMEQGFSMSNFLGSLF
jgi:hypothetical protein